MTKTKIAHKVLAGEYLTVLPYVSGEEVLAVKTVTPAAPAPSTTTFTFTTGTYTIVAAATVTVTS